MWFGVGVGRIRLREEVRGREGGKEVGACFLFSFVSVTLRCLLCVSCLFVFFALIRFG